MRRLPTLAFGSPAPKSTSDRLEAPPRRQPVVSRAFLCPASVIRNKTIQSSGLDPTPPIPPNQSLSWK